MTGIMAVLTGIGSVFKAVLTPDPLAGSDPAGGPGTLSSGTATVTVTGGSGSYTYTISTISGGTGMTAVGANTASPRWTNSSTMGPGTHVEGVFASNVTDTVSGLIVQSNSITASIDAI